MSDQSAIPFNRPSVQGSERAYLEQAISGGHMSGDGPFTRKCHALLQQAMGAHKVLLTTSCTAALEMCALLLDLGPGDEVIIPSFTFVSSVNAFVLRGATPVFIDVRADTLNLDETLLEQAITPRTKAIVVVHYAGVGCEMDAIMRTAERHGIPVVEDNAHGLFGRYRGRELGTLGVLATQSFHETKNFTCGEGGALVINDPRLTARAEILREKGTDRSKYLRGQVDKYTWVDLGSSYLPSDALAAFLLAQLEVREAIQAKRSKLWHTYRTELADWAERNSVGFPTVPDHCEQTYHMFYVLFESPTQRQCLIDELRRNNIGSASHYVPLHLSAMGRRFGGVPGACPVTEDVSDRLLRLPFFNDMTDGDQERVVATIDAVRL
ncbi:MAG TPA: dTDP-4-amino-4,6-dideoxygalactose transaminase [Gemmatimonadaceae bacterium]|jgi:dTDP-4-amino-4,6-dideoxygalactose transaminase